jgi:CBS domain-containing protein
MRAGELCVRDVVTAYPEESVVDAARRMAALHVGDLIVIEDRPSRLPRPIGIVTDRDLVIQVLARPERAAATTTLADVITRDVVTAREDDHLEALVDRMRTHMIRRIPIVDAEGGLQGMVTIDDLIGWLRDTLQAAAALVEHQGQPPRGEAHRASARR